MAAPRTSPALLITRDVRAARARSSAVPPAAANPFVHLHGADLAASSRESLRELRVRRPDLDQRGGPDAHTYPDTQPSRGRAVRPARRQARSAAGTRAAHDVVAAPGHAGHGAQAAE